MGLPASRTFRASEVAGLAVAICPLLVASVAPAYTIVVPDDQPTIQAGIHAAMDGDSVLVAPGTYIENIIIWEKDVFLLSVEGPEVTIIDGSQPANPDSGAVVIFKDSSGSIEGFDIRNGAGLFPGYLSWGGGIVVYFWLDPLQDGPLIRSNWIHDNVIQSEAYCYGGGIHVSFGRARIIDNRIYANTLHAAQHQSAGSAILASPGGFSDLETVIRGNEIYDNHCVGSRPSGTVSVAIGDIRENVIACNVGGSGVALHSIFGAVVESNTIVGNFSVTHEPAVLLGVHEGDCDEFSFTHNNVTDNVGPGLRCSECDGYPVFVVTCNNLSGNFPGGQVTGRCADAIGQDGNISVDPLYGRGGCPHTVGDWCLSENSPLLIDPPPGCGLIGALGLCPPIGIRDREPVVPRHLRASSPRPNPFTSRTTIPFYLAKESEVEVQIYDVLGRRIRTLEAGWLLTGDHVLEWDGRIESGSRAASGAYVARIRAGGEELTRTLLLVR